MNAGVFVSAHCTWKKKNVLVPLLSFAGEGFGHRVVLSLGVSPNVELFRCRFLCVAQGNQFKCFSLESCAHVLRYDDTFDM